ncbi:5-formyltetrahydrofolate cyclo-ligase [Winogradskyella eckloniae]|uniref:5-formyltetrahydrofolate cyclo-ligase n=1 Tax=Winogradskyella eckloniae TaxID=1089306 RepID=UPI001566BBF3|nr:5-formyltetrahydrofolate cyclo-ligase [Winogradskyella eckloniae]NRD19073.1 5-formyltetrahydrofolate cyclo-ligase [Winogradskyella eckloniae]
MTKQELRTKYKTLRQALNDNQIDDNSMAIANQLLRLDIWHKSFYHIFLTIEEQKEINTDFILNILSGKDKHIVISKSNFDDFSMDHVLLTDNTTIKKNHYNIPEPLDGIKIESSQLEVVFIPLLAFDTLGNRVGYGKGFYDRFLGQCQPETIKIGLSFFNAEDHITDHSENDVRLDFCVTPDQIYKF